MADSSRESHSSSPSPYKRHSKSRSRSRSPSQCRGRSPSRSRSPRPRSRSRSHSGSRGSREDPSNPGDTLYVTGLSTRVTERDLKDHFSKKGKVARCLLVVEPRTQISRGFAFVTMENTDDAARCIKHLNQSILLGRYITVEKSRRKRPRTPTPGNYLGAKNSRDAFRNDRGKYRGGYGRDDYGGGYRRSSRRSPYRGGRDYSPRRSPYGGRSRSGRDYSPRRSPYGGRSRRERSRSPIRRSPYGSPDRGGYKRR